MAANQQYDSRTAGAPQRGAARNHRPVDARDLTGRINEDLNSGLSPDRTAHSDVANRAMTAEQFDAQRAAIAERQADREAREQAVSTAKYERIAAMDSLADDMTAACNDTDTDEVTVPAWWMREVVEYLEDYGQLVKVNREFNHPEPEETFAEEDGDTNGE
jgi:hypothetical protein